VASATQSILTDDPDFLSGLVARVVQAVLEAEMTAHLHQGMSTTRRARTDVSGDNPCVRGKRIVARPKGAGESNNDMTLHAGRTMEACTKGWDCRDDRGQRYASTMRRKRE
jgi:hypothetical protein